MGGDADEIRFQTRLETSGSSCIAQLVMSDHAGMVVSGSFFLNLRPQLSFLSL